MDPVRAASLRRLVALLTFILWLPAQARADDVPPVAPVPVGGAPGDQASPVTADGMPMPPLKPWNRLIFLGVRSDLGFPLGSSSGTTISPTLSLEMGYAPRIRGVGWGIRATISVNTPNFFGAFGAETAAFGVLGELRYYFQVAGPVQLYPALAFGWLLGINAGTGNVLPVLNTGFGLRVRLGSSAYVAFEGGLATFIMPYFGLSFGVCGEVE